MLVNTSIETITMKSVYLQNHSYYGQSLWGTLYFMTSCLTKLSLGNSCMWTLYQANSTDYYCSYEIDSDEVLTFCSWAEFS